MTTQAPTNQALTHHADRVDFFQEMILNGLRYWQDHVAVQQIDVPVLDSERDGILNALTRGLEFDRAWPLVRKLIDALASYMERRGYWTAWRTVLERAMAISQRVGDIGGETTMTALLARLSQRQSRGEDVVRYYRRAMRLAKQHDNQYEFARACCNLGYYYIDASRWWRSEVLSLKALEIFEALGSEHGLAHTHNHLGLLYTRQGRFCEVESHLETACELWESMDDNQSMINGLLNLGLLQLQVARGKEALTILKQAEEKCYKSGEKSDLATVLLNMSSAYQSMHEYDKALNYTLRAEKLFLRDGNELGLARVQNSLGLQFHQNDPKRDVMPFFIKALALFKNLNYVDGELDVLANIVRIQIEKRDCRAASIYLDALKAIIQSHPALLNEGDLILIQKYDKRLAALHNQAFVGKGTTN